MFLVALSFSTLATASLNVKNNNALEACAVEDLKHRAQIQNKLADACEDMCKNVGSYPNCSCPNFVQPDATPGVMTWDELLEHMDNLSSWGHDMLKGWKQTASAIQTSKHSDTQKACMEQDMKQRVKVQNKLAGI